MITLCPTMISLPIRLIKTVIRAVDNSCGWFECGVTRHSSNDNATDWPEEGSVLQVLVWDETRPGPNCIKVEVCFSHLGYQVYFC